MTSVVHNVVLYHCRSAQRRSHNPRCTHRQKDGTDSIALTADVGGNKNSFGCLQFLLTGHSINTPTNTLSVVLEGVAMQNTKGTL